MTGLSREIMWWDLEKNQMSDLWIDAIKYIYEKVVISMRIAEGEVVSLSWYVFTEVGFESVSLCILIELKNHI